MQCCRLKFQSCTKQDTKLLPVEICMVMLPSQAPKSFKIALNKTHTQKSNFGSCQNSYNMLQCQMSKL